MFDRISQVRKKESVDYGTVDFQERAPVNRNLRLCDHLVKMFFSHQTIKSLLKPLFILIDFVFINSYVFIEFFEL
jgi:hypothetical protein